MDISNIFLEFQRDLLLNHIDVLGIWITIICGIFSLFALIFPILFEKQQMKLKGKFEELRESTEEEICILKNKMQSQSAIAYINFAQIINNVADVINPIDISVNDNVLNINTETKSNVNLYRLQAIFYYLTAMEISYLNQNNIKIINIIKNINKEKLDNECHELIYSCITLIEQISKKNINSSDLSEIKNKLEQLLKND